MAFPFSRTSSRDGHTASSAENVLNSSFGQEGILFSMSQVADGGLGQLRIGGPYLAVPVA